MSGSTALIVIATGEKYVQYVQPLLLSARSYFVPHTAVVFSDADDIGCGEKPHTKISHEPWPGPTLHRYHTILKAESYLRAFDYIYYVDVDMKFVAPVGDEIFSDGITATLHPGFIIDRSKTLEWTGKYLPSCAGTPERRPESTACIPEGATNAYYCGGFNGGDAFSFLEMAHAIRKNVDIDTQNGIVALWNDESHLNRYLWEHPPARVLTPSFCYPEDYRGQWAWRPHHYKPVLLALDKGKKR